MAIGKTYRIGKGPNSIGLYESFERERLDFYYDRDDPLAFVPKIKRADIERAPRFASLLEKGTDYSDALMEHNLLNCASFLGFTPEQGSSIYKGVIKALSYFPKLAGFIDFLGSVDGFSSLMDRLEEEEIALRFGLAFVKPTRRADAKKFLIRYFRRVYARTAQDGNLLGIDIDHLGMLHLIFLNVENLSDPAVLERKRRHFAAYGFEVDPLSFIVLHEMMHALDRQYSLIGRDYEICHYFAAHPESELRALAGEEENKYEYYASIMALAILLDDKPPLAKELLEATLETINK